MTRIIKPFVKLMDSCDLREKAWRISRSLDKNEEVDMRHLKKADFALNDCATFYLHFGSSVIFRELLMSVSPLSVWSRSSRVDPIAETALSAEYETSENLTYFEGTVREAANGGAQDVARLQLPLSMSSEYVVGTGFRTWISFLKALEFKCPKMFEIYGTMIMKALNITDLGDYNYGNMINSVSFSDKDYKVPAGTKNCYGFTGMKFKTTFTHASHFARHMHNKFRSTVWDLAAKFDEHNFMNLLEPVEVITMMPTDSYEAMLSHRSDWLADYNVWAGFVEAGTADMTVQEYYEMLAPVGNYLADNMARIALTDPNILDARIAECPGLVYKRLETEGDNYIIRRWIEMVEAGLIKDNPNNEHRNNYETNLIAAGRGDFITW